jgi:hypothetical protein
LVTPIYKVSLVFSIPGFSRPWPFLGVLGKAPLIDLSHDFHIEDVKNVTNEIIKKFMSYKDYLELKSISYTRRK